MALTKCRLGNYIELREETNIDLAFGPDDVRGVNNLKLLMPTKADINGRDLTKFQIVRPGEFVFNHRTSRNGGKFSIAYNDGEKPIICTEDYVVFRIRKASQQFILAEWLYMYFNRSEFDRYVITDSWGSSTEFYNWEDICSIELELPSLPVQQKYVDVYLSMLANQQSYERGLADLKLAFDVLLDIQKDSPPTKPLGQIFQEINIQNDDGAITNVQGINIDKRFMPSVANMTDVDLKKYKVINKGQFAYSGMQTGRDECIRIALYTDNEPAIISPAYSVMQVVDDEILPEYIMMWFLRKESDRRGWFMSDASIRTNLDLSRFYEIKIPVPPLPEQKAIVEIYDTYITRREINNVLKARLKDICPILIKGSLKEGVSK